MSVVEMKLKAVNENVVKVFKFYNSDESINEGFVLKSKDVTDVVS